jgi:tRNA-splicing ligase RtcB
MYLQVQPMEIKQIDDYRWEIPRQGNMRVPGMIYTSAQMIDHIIREKAIEQVANVATMPGIVERSMAMPDIHWGYGFPIGGVAAFDVRTGVISPGGIGYDINCGVRLLRTNLKKADIAGRIKELVAGLFSNIPSGVGSTGKVNISADRVKEVLEDGARWAVKNGFGRAADLAHIEEEGRMAGADASCVSAHAIERGREQLGTLGAGNHFLEIQVIDTIYDDAVARVFGLFDGQVTVMIHTGSRGLGYQVCDDHLKILQDTISRYGIVLPDRQLACAPIDSPEGKEYFAAMAGAANYAWANRQLITHWVRETFARVMERAPEEMGLEVVYDVAHNIGKFEEHKGRALLVHRKGATRSFAPGNSAIPADYRSAGQPVIIPGTMGTASYVLSGTAHAMEETWGSTCHGAGRVMSRSQALKSMRGEQVARDLAKHGIVAQSASWKTLAEEAPSAYKNVNEVVDVCDHAGISHKVARLKPLGVVKG